MNTVHPPDPHLKTRTLRGAFVNNDFICKYQSAHGQAGGGSFYDLQGFADQGLCSCAAPPTRFGFGYPLLFFPFPSLPFPSLPFPSFPSLSFPFRSFPFRPSPLRPLLLPRSLPTTLCTTRRYNCILAPLLSVQEPVLSALVPLLLIRGAPATRHYTGTRTATTRTIEPLLRALPPLLRVLEPLHPYYHHCSLVPAPLCCPASPNQDPPRERTLPAHPDQDPPRRHMVHCRVVPCP